MRDIVMKYKSLVEDGQWDTKSEKDVEILALTSHFQELKIHIINNQHIKIETGTYMLVTQGLTIVVEYGKQPLQHLVNLGWKKRTGELFTGANGMNTGLQLTTQKKSEYNTIL